MELKRASVANISPLFYLQAYLPVTWSKFGLFIDLTKAS
jgi:hypothetical protein